MDIKWLRFLIGSLYLIDMWLNEDQRAKIIKTHVQKGLDYIFKCYDHSTLTSEHGGEDLYT